MEGVNGKLKIMHGINSLMKGSFIQIARKINHNVFNLIFYLSQTISPFLILHLLSTSEIDWFWFQLI